MGGFSLDVMGSISLFTMVFDLGGGCIMFYLSLTIFRLDLRTNPSQEEGNNVTTKVVQVLIMLLGFKHGSSSHILLGF